MGDSQPSWAYWGHPIDGSVPCGGGWHFESHSYHSTCPSCNSGWWDNTREADGNSPSFGRHKPEHMTDYEKQEARYPVTIDEYGAWWLEGRIHHIWIQKRPEYCDRGHYLAHVEPAPDAGVEFTIDADDHWPRYFMDFNRMIDELRDWLDWREGDGPKKAGEKVFGGMV